jgi:hypothetical protein
VSDRLVELHERLALPEAVLSRRDLALLGYGRSAIDRIFRACATEFFGDVGDRSRTSYLRVSDFIEYRDQHYRRTDRVRPGMRK